MDKLGPIGIITGEFDKEFQLYSISNSYALPTSVFQVWALRHADCVNTGNVL